MRLQPLWRDSVPESGLVEDESDGLVNYVRGWFALDLLEVRAHSEAAHF